MEATLRELSLGKRFFTLLVIPEGSPLIGQAITTATVPIHLKTDERFNVAST
jgi:hypothetical protein